VLDLQQKKGSANGFVTAGYCFSPLVPAVGANVKYSSTIIGTAKSTNIK